jgi:isoleucyl-tRNA synthetase
VLAFTADEAWEAAGQAGSVHEQDFPVPDPAFAGSGASEAIGQLQGVRDVLQQEIDRARKEKLIGSNLEAAAVLTVPEGHGAAAVLTDLETAKEFLIVSDLVVERGGAFGVEVRRTSCGKCARCWRHLPDVGQHAGHPLLCGRCAAALG